jgi:hypothetical protein
MTPDPITGTFSGNRALQIEEPLIFEQGQPGRTGVDLPAPPSVKDRLGGLNRKGEIGLPEICPSVTDSFCSFFFLDVLVASWGQAGLVSAATVSGEGRLRVGGTTSGERSRYSIGA